jgi:hypothetical protein
LQLALIRVSVLAVAVVLLGIDGGKRSAARAG